MNFREFVIAIPLVVLAIALGVFPNLIFSWMGPDVETLVRQLTDYSSHHFGKTVAGI